MAFLGAIFLAGCSGSKVSVNQPPGAEIKPIHRLAIMPDSGVLGDTIGRALLDRGFNIVTAAETDAMVGGIRINQLGVTAREYYAALHDKGVDAALTASTQMAGDGRPDKANAMVMDTISGNSLIDISWQNGWGGYSGSDADRAMRKSTSEAAQEMAKELITRLRLY
jgi:hypothetical protein